MSQVRYKKAEIIRDVESLKHLAKKMIHLEEIAFDTETNTAEWVRADNPHFRLVGVSISWGDYDNYYIPLGHIFDDEQVLVSDFVRYMKPVFERTDVRLIGWNIKFDLHVLARVGIHVRTRDLYDVMIAMWLCEENREVVDNSLEGNALHYLGAEMESYNNIVKQVPPEDKIAAGLKKSNKATMDLVRIDIASQYALDDSFYTWVLYLFSLEYLAYEGMEEIFYKEYVPYVRTVYNKEVRGVEVDQERLEEMRQEIEKDLDDLKYKMYEIAGVEFKPSSGKQLTELLFKFDDPELNKNPNEDLLAVSFDFPVQTLTAGGKPQTNMTVLNKLAGLQYKTKRKQEGVELCKLLIAYSKLDKLNSAFIGSIPQLIYPDGKLHPDFKIIGTVTGRLSCAAPNLQQLPTADDDDKYQIRSLFRGSIDEKTGKRKHIIAID